MVRVTKRDLVERVNQLLGLRDEEDWIDLMPLRKSDLERLADLLSDGRLLILLGARQLRGRDRLLVEMPLKDLLREPLRMVLEGERPSILKRRPLISNLLKRLASGR